MLHAPRISSIVTARYQDQRYTRAGGSPGKVPPVPPPSAGGRGRWIPEFGQQGCPYIGGRHETGDAPVQVASRLQDESAGHHLRVAKHHLDRVLVEPIDRPGGEVRTPEHLLHRYVVSHQGRTGGACRPGSSSHWPCPGATCQPRVSKRQRVAERQVIPIAARVDRTAVTGRRGAVAPTGPAARQTSTRASASRSPVARPSGPPFDNAPPTDDSHWKPDPPGPNC